jgi:hypothetical protein
LGLTASTLVRPTLPGFGKISQNAHQAMGVSTHLCLPKKRWRAGGTALDLRRVVLEHQGDDLHAIFTLANTLPPTGEFTLAVLASSYVVDPSAPIQNLKGEPFVDGKVIKATFPWSAVSDLGADWNWDAATAVEGEDADYCWTIFQPSASREVPPSQVRDPCVLGTKGF